jgi:hypothetical protein
MHHGAKSTLPVTEKRLRPNETKAFRAWFGASKIVDKHGMPLILYHGTDKAFHEFSPEKIGSRTDKGYYGHGFTFTPHAGVASSFAGSKPESNVKAVYLRVQRPFSVEAYVGHNAVPQAMKRAGMEPEQFPKTITSALKAAGYDGVSVVESDGTLIEVLVFDTAQIRSIFRRNAPASLCRHREYRECLPGAGLPPGDQRPCLAMRAFPQ